ncbi:MAG: Holliday junction DNA helicase RuvA [Desulfobacterales bacterium]|nr:MAG: Holliday junction DNA helicase RuvA [Desulfobacterales bacterium]
MIGYLEGRIIHRQPESILLLAGQVGYEVLLDPVTLARVAAGQNHVPEDEKDRVSLFIYYHVTDRQPKPVLIGFLTPEDKEFFQLFITVSAIGPLKAVKALIRPMGEVAQAIEDRDIGFLSQLSGIGKRTAEKIVATLNGKVTRFASAKDADTACSSAIVTEPSAADVPIEKEDISRQVAEVLVEQLGHSAASARRMIKEAFERNPAMMTPEDLFDEIYQESR